MINSFTQLIPSNIFLIFIGISLPTRIQNVSLVIFPSFPTISPYLDDITL